MKTPAPQIRETLWKAIEPEIKSAMAPFIKLGVVPSKGQTKKDALLEVMIEVAKTAYLTGLDRGYDMAAEVFGDSGEG